MTLEIIDDIIVFQLSVVEGSEAAAIAAAAAAEEDAAAAAASEVKTRLDAVATGEDRVQTGLDAIATNEDRTQTGLDAIATAADRVQTGLDRVATGEDRVQTGLDRIQTGEDVIAAQVAKIEWQGDWVAGTYQIHDAVSYLGSSWIANKETAETPSLAAVDWDLMAEKGDDGDALPTGDENDLLQANGAGVFEAKSPTLVNQSLVPFYNSVLGSEIDLKNVFFWDNFKREDTANGVISTSDSGIDWVNINGVPGTTRIEDNYLFFLGIGQIWGINIAGGRDVEISGSVIMRLGNTFEHSYLIGRDSSNYYRFRFNPFTFQLIECLAGTETVLLSITASNLGPIFGEFRRLFDNRAQTMKFRIGTNLAGDEYIGGYVDQIGSFRIASIAANYASILPNGRSDINFIGVGKFSTLDSRQSSIIATYVSL